MPPSNERKSRWVTPVRRLGQNGFAVAHIGRSARTTGQALLAILVVALVIVAAPCPTTNAAPAKELASARCPAAEEASGNASPALQQCLAALPPGGTLALTPKIYMLSTPLVIRQPVTIMTAGATAASPPCPTRLDQGCATLSLKPMATQLAPKQMPIEIAASRVTFLNLRIVGSGGHDPGVDRSICQNAATRPAGGGIRVEGQGFSLMRSAIYGVTCYTAMEVRPGANGLTVDNNNIGPNGNHQPGSIWSDGLTIQDVESATVVNNSFYDNTDVQLIFGGCQKCTIEGNSFRHSGTFQGSSFAELMLQSWPTTSGNYLGSATRNNSIDCTRKRRCGYGIMIGSNPWYQGRAFGGEVSYNRVRNAMIGINVDALTGLMTIAANQISASGGRFVSACGTRSWPAFNVSPASKSRITGSNGTGNVDTAGCLLNRQPS